MSDQAQAEATQDQMALLANDVRVLVAQLNETVKRSAEKGLRVEIDTSGIIDIKGSATFYPVVSVKILAEIR